MQNKATNLKVEKYKNIGERRRAIFEFYVCSHAVAEIITQSQIVAGYLVESGFFELFE